MKVEVNGKSYDYGNRFSNDQRENQRRTPPEMRKGFVVAEMNERQHEVVRRLALGQKGTTIAKDLGLSVATITNIKNSPICRRQIDLIRGAADKTTMGAVERIKELADRAVDILEESLESDEVNMALKSRNAITILGMNGIAPQKNVSVRSAHLHLQPSDLDKIKDRAVELGIVAEDVLDRI